MHWTMTTRAQRLANRRNAQLSTGPKSQSGKASSRLNAQTHGLSVRLELIPDDPDQRLAIEQVMSSGYERERAASIVLTLLEHRRVMDAYRELYLDEWLQDLINQEPGVEPATCDEFEDFNILRELVPEAADPNDHMTAQMFLTVARFQSRTANRKVNSLRRLGRYQRRSSAQLSKTCCRD